MYDFDRNHPKWQTSCCHVTSAAYVIALVEILISCVSLVIFVTNVAADYSNTQAVHYAAIGFCGAGILAAVILIIGTKMRREKLLIPHIVMQVVVFILMLTFMVAVCMTGELEEPLYIENIAGVTPSNPWNKKPMTLSIVAGLLMASGALIVTVYSIYVLIKLKNYIVAERKHLEMLNTKVRVLRLCH